MANAFPIDANDRVYTVVDDCVTAYAAIITGSVTDEILGDFASPGLNVTSSFGGLKPTTTSTGLYALTGYPDHKFPATVELKFSAPGFQNQSWNVGISSNATFPIDGPNVALRRLPVSLQGRVVDKNSLNPVSGALVLSIDDPGLTPPPAIHAIALRSPLYLAHPNATQVQNVTITSGASFQLTTDAIAGSPVLNLFNRNGLAANSILQLSNPSKSILEYCIVDHLGSGPANQPGQVFIRQPLNRSYATGAATNVRVVTATLSGTVAQLSGDASAGDGILLATQPLNSNTIVVDPGTPAKTEYHELGAVADGDGYYGIAGVGRVRELFLQARNGSKADLVNWYLQFEKNVNTVNFLLHT
jgi:hypothetical protein